MSVLGVSRADERRVELEGMLNVRDLGGLPTADGRVIKRGQLLRMDSPQFMTESAAQQLVDQGFKTILDLRYEIEVESEGIGHLGDDRMRHVRRFERGNFFGTTELGQNLLGMLSQLWRCMTILYRCIRQLDR